jgi:hypothetical protein
MVDTTAAGCLITIFITIFLYRKNKMPEWLIVAPALAVQAEAQHPHSEDVESQRASRENRSPFDSSLPLVQSNYCCQTGNYPATILTLW